MTWDSSGPRGCRDENVREWTHVRDHNAAVHLILFSWEPSVKTALALRSRGH
jgi:hypothetical protein